MVFGDSHARQWMPAVLWAASQDGWSVVPLVKLGCKPDQYDGRCNAYYHWALDQIRGLHPDVVLIAGQLMVNTPEEILGSVTGISMMVDAVKPFAKRVVVIGDPPAQGLNPIDCLLARDATLAKCTWTLTASQISVYTDVARAAHRLGVGFLDTIGWFCFENQCPMVVGDTVTHWDTAHITRTYGLELRALFRDAFTSAVSG